MKHVLKIWPEYYERVRNGSKTFEIRKNDRNFNLGDLVELRYFDPEFKPSPVLDAKEIAELSSREFPPLTFRIGFVMALGSFLKCDHDDMVCFSLLPLETPAAEPATVNQRP